MTVARLALRGAVIIFAVLCLAWALHDVRFPDLVEHLKHVSLWWVAYSIVMEVSSYYVQGWRWRLLLCDIGNISGNDASMAVLAGVFVNKIFPFRAGEVFRAYLVSRELGVPLSHIVPSMVAERFIDGCWLVVGGWLCVASLPVRVEVRNGTLVLSAIVAVIAAVLLGIVLSQKPLPSAGSGQRPVVRGASSFLENVRTGLLGIRGSRCLLGAVALSLALRAVQIVAFWLLIVACRIHVSFWAATAVMITLRVGTAVPNTPGAIGSYQVLAVVGLVMFGVERSAALSFSIVAFFLPSIALLAVGFVAFNRTGLSLGEIRRRAGERTTWKLP
jgi:glycosyltransferase 2 family protein